MTLLQVQNETPHDPQEMKITLVIFNHYIDNKKKKYLNTELFCLCSTVWLVGNIYYDEKFLWLSIWPIHRFFCQQICSTCAIFTIFNIYNATMPCMIWGGCCSFYVIQRYWPSHKFPAEMGKTIFCVSLKILMIPNSFIEW